MISALFALFAAMLGYGASQQHDPVGVVVWFALSYWFVSRIHTDGGGPDMRDRWRRQQRWRRWR